MFRSHSLHNWFGLSRSRKQRRRQTAQTPRLVRLEVETLEERVTPSGGGTTVTQIAGSHSALTALIAADPKSQTTSGTASPTPSPTLPSVTIVPGNGSATFSTAAQSVSITVGVNSTDTVNVGTMSVMAFNGSGTTVASNAAPVSGGTAIVALSLPSSLAVGAYTLTEVYTDSSGHFAANSAVGTLTINPTSSPSPAPSPSPSPIPSPPPGPSPNSGPTQTEPLTQSEAYVEIAIDVAALLLQGNSVSLTGLWDLSEALLGKPLPPASDLLAQIFVDLPFAGDMGGSAVQLGIAFAGSASFEVTGSGGAKSFIR